MPEYAELEPAERAAGSRSWGAAPRRGGPRNCWTGTLLGGQARGAQLIQPPAEQRPGRGASRLPDAEGQACCDFATWCALVEVHGPEWMAWPEPLRDPATPRWRAERRRLADRVEFRAWLQWQLDEQLAHRGGGPRRPGWRSASSTTSPSGCTPRAPTPGRCSDVLAIGVSVGAPPDAFTQQGQDWSQPPWKPNRLAELGYAPYRDMMRAVLRHAGGLRVDHVMGMFRLWWVPAGRKPSEGTYVRYDHEAMVGVLALEAQRAGAVVIGEDLGTVEPWVRDYLHERGMLGTSILFFERDEVGPLLRAWRGSAGHRHHHDLPPTPATWPASTW